MPGPGNKPETPKVYSQTQGPGMKPVYASIGRDGQPTGFLGYEQDPNAGVIDVPKPPEILAKEKELGHELEPVYAEGQKFHGSGAAETVNYGTPIGYRYDNGKSQYVNFDPSGQQTSIQDRQNLGTLIKDLAPLALTAFGANYLMPLLGGAGAAAGAGEGIAALGAGESLAGAASLTPEALAASELAAYAPASLAGETAAGITSLTPEALAASELAAYPTASLAGEAAAGVGGAGTLTAEQLAASELAAYQPASLAGNTGISSLGGSGSLFDAAASPLASGYSPSITALTNEAVASGMSPGSLGALNAASLTPEALAAASGVVTAGATPALVDAAAKGAQSYIDSGGASQAGAGGGPNGTDVFKEVSKNQAVASGLGAGSMGADLAAKGTLTAQELAAAAGTAGALNKDGIGDLLTKAKDKLLGSSDSGSGSGLGGTLGLLALMSMMNKGGGGTPASTATIPELTANRSQLPYDVDKKGVNPNTPYRPGQGGVTYFSPTTYTPTKAAGGGLMSLGQSNLGGYSDGGRLLQGPGDGVSDSIPAIIGRKQPARLANGEFVIPARIVSELGNGSTDAGAKRLYEMMDRVQKVRRNTKNVAANTKASKYLPA